MQVISNRYNALDGTIVLRDTLLEAGARSRTAEDKRKTV